MNEAADFSEEICNDLVGITAAQNRPSMLYMKIKEIGCQKPNNGKRYEFDFNNRILSKIGAVLESTDRRTIPFLDVLIENELKKVISNSAVQQYVGKIYQYFIMSTQDKVALAFYT